ncbi:hypothetical protein M3Y95_00966900 [Aphelenchoides besseyi]|nr:hypothetical protein M3Y95_00966900 [Aphelenchoides besseyi]
MSQLLLYDEYEKNPEIMKPAFLAASLQTILVNLHNRASVFLSILCISNVVAQSGTLVFVYGVFNKTNFLPLTTCFHLQFIPMIGLTHGIVLPVVIAFDRLLQVWFPIHNQNGNNVFLVLNGLKLLLCEVYIAISLYNAYDAMLQLPDKMVYCTVFSPLIIVNTKFYFLGSTAITLSAALYYALIWIRIYSSQGIHKSLRQSLRSFTAIMIVLSFASASTSTSKIVFVYLDASTAGLFRLEMFNQTLLNFTFGASSYMLYIFSYDYRIALQKQFYIVFGCLTRNRIASELSTKRSVRHKPMYS